MNDSLIRALRQVVAGILPEGAFLKRDRGNGLSATGFRRKVRSVLKNYAKITLKPTKGGEVKPVKWQRIGKKITLRAISGRGYRFVGWFDKKGKRVSSRAKYRIKVKKSVVYKATFKKEK